MRFAAALMCTALVLTACGDNAPPPNQKTIKIRGPEQDALHQLDALNLAIALKRAIYSAGYLCKRVSDGGFVAEYQNLDMWMARCTDGKTTTDWAVFAGADGSAQVRLCKDVDTSQLPKCEIKQRPKGKFS